MTDDLTRRRAWAASGREMLERSYASGARKRPVKKAQPLPPELFVEKASGDWVRDAKRKATCRKGKRPPTSWVQRRHLAQSKVSVSLPSISILGGDE
jgi:hypothetical protein